MKNNRIEFRISNSQKDFLKLFAKAKGVTTSEIIELAVKSFIDNENILTSKANTIVNNICDLISDFENFRDYSNNLNEDEIQFLKSLDFCYQLLIRTNMIKNDSANTVPMPQKMKDSQDDQETTFRHALCENKTADELINSFK